MSVLSPAVVPVFALTILMNAFYYDVVQSLETTKPYKSCKECMDSGCLLEHFSYCVDGGAPDVVNCFNCEATSSSGMQQFYSEEGCKMLCDDGKCKCDGGCYVCVEKKDKDTPRKDCAMPATMYNSDCEKQDYEHGG